MNHCKSIVSILAFCLCFVAQHAVAQCTNPTQGPDVIVGDLIDMTAYGKVGNISGFDIGTTSCNIGNVNVNWIAGDNQHPVIGQNMYRLKNGRFEQIGMSWLKNGFTALTQSLCCSCNGQGGPVLGIGCSDPYCCGLNGGQARLGPRSEVNAATGLYTYPYIIGWQQTGNNIYKRLQIKDVDLDPGQNAGAQYFGETQYVTRDDATAGNQNNNASYRKVNVSATGTFPNATYTLTLTNATQRTKPAILAWQDTDPLVQVTNVNVPGDGRMIVAWKVTNPAPGTYHYEYAIENLTSDRSGQGLVIPVIGAIISNVGFHDVDYHSGEPFSLTDWAVTQTGGNITWQTDTFATNPNANALRWGTTYNFRFDATTGPLPANVNATIKLFKNGTPTEMLVSVAAPAPADCNNNGVLDNLDIAAGTSQDCNENAVPDECDLATNDCNHNGVVDACELIDCNGNGIMDSCETGFVDCNANGVIDTCELQGHDCDGNGVLDSCQLAGHDSDNNGILDACEADCDHNGQIDAFEILSGAPDCNGNGVPDSCDTNAPSTTASPNILIPDNNATGVSSMVTYPGNGTVTDVNLTVNIPHTAVSNLKVTLSHGATSVVVWNNRCGSFDNLMATFDDAGAFINCSDLAGTYRPNSTGGTVLSAFNGIPAAGDWTLNVSDNVANDSGRLQSWSLSVTSSIPPAPPYADANNDDIPDTCQCGMPGLPDLNLNGVADSCECMNCKGDANKDGRINGRDIAVLVRCLSGEPLVRCVDMDNNQVIDAADLALFITAVTSANPPCTP